LFLILRKKEKKKNTTSDCKDQLSVWKRKGRKSIIAGSFRARRRGGSGAPVLIASRMGRCGGLGGLDGRSERGGGGRAGITGLGRLIVVMMKMMVMMMMVVDEGGTQQVIELRIVDVVSVSGHLRIGVVRGDSAQRILDRQRVLEFTVCRRRKGGFRGA
jgi:hypothetical protein